MLDIFLRWGCYCLLLVRRMTPCLGQTTRSSIGFCSDPSLEISFFVLRVWGAAFVSLIPSSAEFVEALCYALFHFRCRQRWEWARCSGSNPGNLCAAIWSKSYVGLTAYCISLLRFLTACIPDNADSVSQTRKGSVCKQKYRALGSNLAHKLNTQLKVKLFLFGFDRITLEVSFRCPKFSGRASDPGEHNRSCFSGNVF